MTLSLKYDNWCVLRYMYLLKAVKDLYCWHQSVAMWLKRMLSIMDIRFSFSNHKKDHFKRWWEVISWKKIIFIRMTNVQISLICAHTSQTKFLFYRIFQEKTNQTNFNLHIFNLIEIIIPSTDVVKDFLYAHMLFHQTSRFFTIIPTTDVSNESTNMRLHYSVKILDFLHFS